MIDMSNDISDCKQNEFRKAHIIIDDRENEIYSITLRELGSETTTKRLTVGDFILSYRCAVERKTRNDFESSIIDGRLFDQVQRMSKTYERSLIIVEGEPQSETRIKKQALLGAYSSLIINYSVPIFFTKNYKSTSELLYAIAKYEQISNKRQIRIKMKKKCNDCKQLQQAIVESLPNVGPVIANNLLLHFKSAKNIFNANLDELESVDGVGKIRAKLIFNTINSVHNSKNED